MSTSIDRVAWLRSQRTRPTAVWIEFVQRYARHPGTLFAFFEGKDDSSFYLPELRRRWHFGEIHPLACDGKSGVMDALSRVTGSGSDYDRVLFFCDKDLDDIIGRTPPPHPKLFTTGVYSIENYVVSEEAFRQAWTDLFKLPASDSRLETELGRIRAGLTRFHKMCTPLMAWILIHRITGDRLLLNQLKLSRIVDVTPTFLPRWRRRDRVAGIQGMCPELRRSGTKCIRAAARRFHGRDPKEYIRGKFELWYFTRVLQRCLERLAKDPPGTRPACSVNISEANALEILSGRGRLPRDLEEFLARSVAEAGAAQQGVAAVGAEAPQLNS